MPKPIDTAEFEAFWSAYPRKVAKGAARRAWAKAMRVADAVQIMTALNMQKAAGFGRDLTYTKHPATWLNGECWTDEIPVAAGHPPAPAGEAYGF